MNKVGKCFDQGVVSGGKFGFLNVLIFGFLAFNLVIRFSTIFYYPPYNAHIAAVFGAIVSCCILVILFPRYLKAFLFIFGFSFFLFGFGATTIQSRVFELIVTCVATALFVIHWKNKASSRLNKRLGILILCYIGLSLFSLLLLPLRQIVKDFWFLGFPESFFNLFIGPPYSFYYPVAAVIRLLLFVIFAIQLSMCAISPATPAVHSGSAGNNPDLDFSAATSDAPPEQDREGNLDTYKALMAGIFLGAVFCAFIGLLDFYGIISLRWYTFGLRHGFQSTFLNPGWFAEFVLTAVPFVLIGFMSKIKGIWWKILLFGALVVCEIGLILSKARAGWVSYPLILAICWVFQYFSKEGRFESFHFKKRDLIKIAFSVPVTILISLVLLFQVLGPLSEVRKDRTVDKGVQEQEKVQTESNKHATEERSEELEARKKGVQEQEKVQTESNKHATEERSEELEARKKRYEALKEGALDAVTPRLGGRVYTWKEGFNVGRESSLFGTGYESFAWHACILAKVRHSFYGIQHFREGRLNPNWIHETPHSLLFQIFVSGGMVGVYLWVLIIGYAVTVLIFDLIKNKRLLNAPFIASIISFHLYGIFQSMQYVPMIWLLIFLNLGYAMTIDDDVLPSRVKWIFGFLTKISIVLVGVSLFVYSSNFESRNLSEKYDKRIYAMDQDRDRFAGFFHYSKRWEYGDYRWSGKQGAIYVPGGGEIKLEFQCRTPDAEKDPVLLNVLHDGRVLDQIVFGGDKPQLNTRRMPDSTEQGAEDGGQKSEVSVQRSEHGNRIWFTVIRKYALPKTPDEDQRLVVKVSRTWNPHNDSGNFDRRELGIGVKVLRKGEVGGR